MALYQSGRSLAGEQFDLGDEMIGGGQRSSRALQDVIKRRELREAVAAEHQTYALGFRETWEVPEGVHREGHIEHTVGYPLGQSTFGGGHLYHLSERRIAVGFHVALDYRNTHLSPYEEFQRWKKHPYVSRVLEGGTCLTYGAHTVPTGLFLHTLYSKLCSIDPFVLCFVCNMERQKSERTSLQEVQEASVPNKKITLKKKRSRLSNPAHISQ